MPPITDKPDSDGRPPARDWWPLARQHPLLASIEDAALRRVFSRCVVREFAPGEPVLRAGQPNEALYLTLSGEMHVVLDPSQPANRVAIAAGECIGEMSVIEQKPVSADVVAGEDACALEIPEAVFWSMLTSEPGVARGLLRAMSERMRQRSELVIKGARERLELEAVQRELTLAREVQASMLADGEALLREQPAVEAAAFMEPAHGVGGDFFDAFSVDSRRVFIAVGDVAGKGIAAALFMARSLATLRLEVLNEQPPETLLHRFNRALCEHNEHSTFVTLFAGYLDTRSGVLTYFCAGHHASLVVSPTGRVIPLPRPDGLVAGALADAPYAVATHTLAPGDVLVAFSDGVTEAHAPDASLFGEQRVQAALAAARPRTAVAAVTTIRSALAQFTGATPQFDDVTVLAICLKSPEAPRPG